MTWEEAKQQIAEKYSCSTWEELVKNAAGWNYNRNYFMYKEAAELFRDTYAKIKWEEACREQGKLILFTCSKVLTDEIIEFVANTPKPQFKP